MHIKHPTLEKTVVIFAIHLVLLFLFGLLFKHACDVDSSVDAYTSATLYSVSVGGFLILLLATQQSAKIVFYRFLLIHRISQFQKDSTILLRISKRLYFVIKPKSSDPDDETCYIALWGEFRGKLSPITAPDFTLDVLENVAIKAFNYANADFIESTRYVPNMRVALQDYAHVASALLLAIPAENRVFIMQRISQK